MQAKRKMEGGPVMISLIIIIILFILASRESVQRLGKSFRHWKLHKVSSCTHTHTHISPFIYLLFKKVIINLWDALIPSVGVLLCFIEHQQIAEINSYLNI